MKIAILPACALAAAALTACLFDSSGSASAPAAPGERFVSYPYAQADSAIILSARVDSQAFCLGDALQHQPHPVGPDTVRFEVGATSLKLFAETQTQSYGAKTRTYSGYERVGSGTGLAGNWKLVREDYVVVSGTLDANEKYVLDKGVKTYQALSVYGDAYVRFAGGRAETYYDVDEAKRFVDTWTGAFWGKPALGFGAAFAIEATALDRNTVVLKGEATGESVRILVNAHGDRGFTSDNPAHAAHQYRFIPVACPNPEYPAWFADFKEANRRAARAAP